MSTSIDEVVFVDLTEDFDVPCDVNVTTDCEYAAKWIAVTACCGTPIFLCDEHKESILVLMQKNEKTRCEFCGKIDGYGNLIMSLEPM